MIRAALLIVLCASTGCTTVWRATFHKPEVVTESSSRLKRAPFIKAHTEDGRVLVFDRWSLSAGDTHLEGNGVEYDAFRRKVRQGAVAVAVQDITMVEATEARRLVRAEIVTMAVMTGITVLITGICAGSGGCF